MIDQKIYNDIIEEVKNINGSLIDLGMHSKAISDYLQDAKISSWFHIAWSIKDIDYDGINYDASFYYCRPSYEYESAKQDLFKSLVSEITFFTYLYSGLESYITSLKLKNCPIRKGKINAATYFIKSKLDKQFFSFEYGRLINLVKTAYCYSTGSELQKDTLHDCIDRNGLGLYILYKVRNDIMHGDFFFPEPLDYDLNRLPLQPVLINICSRLILMTMQMLIYAAEDVNSKDCKSFASSTFFSTLVGKKYYCAEDCNKGECEADCIFISCNKAAFLKQIHFKNADYNAIQLDLDL
ncbi:hypothetical protein GR160_10720 [Flavobacterium sp. Sd200]|uniref:hypothetical protein n=1 Tax=Flavobacterium sp. Sd200 TaxID=2692211 RepID=UPI00136E6CF8|nr:hypothetical protein [Flavobacterium sp. Sd200]MXN91699.1 hypothetical protein [Flavobacterium sp. Sd200]